MTPISGPASDAPLKKGVSVIVPAYQSSHSLHELVSAVEAALAPSIDFEIVIVDDGSSPQTWEAISAVAAPHHNVRGLRLGRNYGQDSALLAGIRDAQFKYSVTIDDDLQYSPSDVARLLNVLEAGEADVVYGTPKSVKRGAARRANSRIARLLLRTMFGAQTARDSSSFRAFSTRLREAISPSVGPNVSLDALLMWSTDRFASVEVDHRDRHDGRSTYNFRRLIRVAVDNITGYSVLPLKLASFIGLLTAAAGLLLVLYVVIPPLTGRGSVPGFPFLAASLAIFSGVQLLAIGIIGEYLARIHLRVMRKPTYFVAERTDLERDR